MTKLKKLSAIVRLLLKKPYLLNLILEHNDYFSPEIKKHYPQYSNGLPSISFHKLLGNNEITISPYSLAEGGSLISDIALLKLMAQRFAPDGSFFEIGTWRGETIANIAPILKNCFTLNLSVQQLKKLNLNENYIKQQDLYSKSFKNITHLKGDSATFDFSPYYGKIDLVFVDGDHHYTAVKKDTETAFKLLRDKKSIIVWHDYAYNPSKIRFEVFKAILDGTPKEKHKNLYHASNTMSALYINETFPTTSLHEIINTKKYFDITLGSHKN